MTEPIIAAAETALPVIEKALAPEAAALIADARAYLVTEGAKIKADIDAHHNAVITWLEAKLATSNTPNTPAAPAA